MCRHLKRAQFDIVVASGGIVPMTQGDEAWRPDTELFHCDCAVIDEIYRSRSIQLADGSKKPLDIYIPREEGDLLYRLLRCLQPSCTVEVGMANGLSTLFIARALYDNGYGRHIAIDPFEFSDWKGTGLHLLRQAGLDALVELIAKPSHQALPELEQAGTKAQFIFVDGSHLFDHVITDFRCADRILDVGGLIAFDDSDWPAVNQAIRYVLANRKYAVAFPEIVIERPPIRPTVAAGLLRAAGRAMPALGAKLRPDFLAPGDRIGVLGRCVVLRKLAEDDRDSQSRCHDAF